MQYPQAPDVSDATWASDRRIAENDSPFITYWLQASPTCNGGRSGRALADFTFATFRSQQLHHATDVRIPLFRYAMPPSVRPPSTRSTCPVMYEACSLARNNTA